MFEQTFLASPERARKPYSMALSLLLQAIGIGVLCLLPFVFTQALRTMQLKTVLAAPPKPPSILKAISVPASQATQAPRAFHLASLLLQTKRPLTDRPEPSAMAPPAVGVEEAGGDPNGVPFGAGNTLQGTPIPAPPPVSKPRPAKQEPIRVGTIAAANIIRMVQPVYPPLARANRIQGVVEFTATISKQGSIENLSLVRGHPLLVNAARDAVLQWRYRPTLLNGEPVEVITDILVNFTLSQ